MSISEWIDDVNYRIEECNQELKRISNMSGCDYRYGGQQLEAEVEENLNFFQQGIDAFQNLQFNIFEYGKSDYLGCGEYNAESGFIITTRSYDDIEERIKKYAKDHLEYGFSYIDFILNCQDIGIVSFDDCELSIPEFFGAINHTYDLAILFPMQKLYSEKELKAIENRKKEKMLQEKKKQEQTKLAEQRKRDEKEFERLKNKLSAT